ncbi:hypothetical protein LY90DRAFT_509840 [Neocallimastix californiae]|uniref:Importin N-terminal domain-containing protein n=1 Tax=Neocallimastix californiae TaxID=1754190 RepID=A0A1Y2C8K0_9FUNG|nr:hypothetical protein LY90DRAFT_509840 [Neocallimastix californiae]|eukprot:ORY43204.1 hypothetical protein LY90DRAFT_509840 [Neocallimastix californiae]
MGAISSKIHKEKFNEYIINGDIEKIKLILKHAKKNQIKQTLNEINKTDGYNHSIGLVNDIVLDLNERDENGWYPFYFAADHNNTEMIKLLINYAEKHQTELILNEVDKTGRFPITVIINNHNNPEIIEIVKEYVVKNDITLRWEPINEKKEQDEISKEQEMTINEKKNELEEKLEKEKGVCNI